MTYKTHNNIAEIITDIKITDVQGALDFIMSAKYTTNCEKLIVSKSIFDESFFILSTGLAGEILQKFINYGIKIAIVGDYGHYTSKPLKDFIYESNNGHDIFFVENTDCAIKMLERV